MGTISALWLAVVLSLCFASTTFAHGLGIIGTGPPKASAAERAAIFGDHTTFSAVARMAEKGGDVLPASRSIGHLECLVIGSDMPRH